MKIWDQAIADDLLDVHEREWLSKYEAVDCPPVEDIWAVMDTVWHEMELNNRAKLDNDMLSAYYSHPVWTLNGLYTEADEVSSSHRKAIAQFINKYKLKHGADYGGGFGTLAQQITDLCPICKIDIIEPYPSKIALDRVKNYDRINFVSESDGPYDFIIAQDVLEHVENPIDLTSKLINMLKPGGFAFFANCFYPVIQCHLPSTFHLRHTFKWVVAPIGIEYIGGVPGAEHTLVFRKNEQAEDTSATRNREKIALQFGGLLNGFFEFLTKVKSLMKIPLSMKKPSNR